MDRIIGAHPVLPEQGDVVDHKIRAQDGGSEIQPVDRSERSGTEVQGEVIVELIVRAGCNEGQVHGIGHYQGIHWFREVVEGPAPTRRDVEVKGHILLLEGSDVLETDGIGKLVPAML